MAGMKSFWDKNFTSMLSTTLYFLRQLASIKGMPNQCTILGYPIIFYITLVIKSPHPTDAIFACSITQYPCAWIEPFLQDIPAQLQPYTSPHPPHHHLPITYASAYADIVSDPAQGQGCVFLNIGSSDVPERSHRIASHRITRPCRSNLQNRISDSLTNKYQQTLIPTPAGSLIPPPLPGRAGPLLPLPKPSTSCPPPFPQICTTLKMSPQADSILSTIGSILSILTFLSALTLSLYLYARAAAASPQEINEFIISLQFSFEEMQRFAHTYAGYVETGPGQALAAKAYMIEGHTAVRLESLRQLALKVGSMAHDSAVRRWTHRVRYVLLQEEVRKQVGVKDRLMEDLRRVQERLVAF